MTQPGPVGKLSERERMVFLAKPIRKKKKKRKRITVQEFLGGK